ncbi:MAG TPA: zinc-ribbon domain-containing protein [Euryarchaeota archaeon]|nr:zinc-ribbon domain-containing protein [Euryarchaeota archaeon]
MPPCPRCGESAAGNYCPNCGMDLRGIFESYKLPGPPMFIWQSVQDEDTCDFCRDMHGHSFRLDRAPKTHPGCRCVLIQKRETACPRCHLENSDEARYCRKCGTALPREIATRRPTIDEGWEG